MILDLSGSARFGAVVGDAANAGTGPVPAVGRSEPAPRTESIVWREKREKPLNLRTCARLAASKANFPALTELHKIPVGHQLKNHLLLKDGMEEEKNKRGWISNREQPWAVPSSSSLASKEGQAVWFHR